MYLEESLAKLVGSCDNQKLFLLISNFWKEFNVLKLPEIVTIILFLYMIPWRTLGV
jgi:hypothetical protein